MARLVVHYFVTNFDVLRLAHGLQFPLTVDYDRDTDLGPRVRSRCALHGLGRLKGLADTRAIWYDHCKIRFVFAPSLVSPRKVNRTQPAVDWMLLLSRGLFPYEHSLAKWVVRDQFPGLNPFGLQYSALVSSPAAERNFFSDRLIVSGAAGGTKGARFSPNNWYGLYFTFI